MEPHLDMASNLGASNEAGRWPGSHSVAKSTMERWDRSAHWAGPTLPHCTPWQRSKSRPIWSKSSEAMARTP